MLISILTNEFTLYAVSWIAIQTISMQCEKWIEMLSNFPTHLLVNTSFAVACSWYDSFNSLKNISLSRFPTRAVSHQQQWCFKLLEIVQRAILKDEKKLLYRIETRAKKNFSLFKFHSVKTGKSIAIGTASCKRVTCFRRAKRHKSNSSLFDYFFFTRANKMLRNFQKKPSRMKVL